MALDAQVKRLQSPARDRDGPRRQLGGSADTLAPHGRDRRKGLAAHWKYKIGEGDEESELQIWLQTIKDILEDPEPSAIDFLDTLKLNLFASEIVVFTPSGELWTLPAGATVLDMAFNLHSELARTA